MLLVAPASCLGASGFKFWLNFQPISLLGDRGRQQLLLQVLKSLPCTWETRMEFQVHGSVWRSDSCCSYLGRESANGIPFSLLLNLHK